MKKTYFRTAAFMVALLTAISGFAKPQDICGKVTDEKGTPLPFVNVVLLSLPDSAFVQGAVTDDDGLFRIVTNANEGLLKLSCMGYETVFVKPIDGQTIQMKEDTHMLGEVVVKSQLPQTHAKGDAMRTTGQQRTLPSALRSDTACGCGAEPRCPLCRIDKGRSKNYAQESPG